MPVRSASVGRMSAHVTGVRLSLWRAATVFRCASLIVCLYLIVQWHRLYQHPSAAYAAGIGMIAVTALVGVLGWSGRANRWPVVGVDVVATGGLTLLTIVAQTTDQRYGSQLMPTLTTIWAAGPCLEAAIVGGWLAGLVAALVQIGSAMIVRTGIDGQLWSSSFILLAAGTVTGYVSTLAVRAEADVAAAAAERAALAEREWLARSIHDGVLQVLGLTHRLGRDDDGELGRIAALAADQEAAVRALISSRPMAQTAVGGELGAALRALRAERVSVATPAEPVHVPPDVCRELTAAVGAALANVDRHAGPGACAWVLLEDHGDAVTVTVRDDGVGFDGDRLTTAAADGRLGVTSSIKGRARDLGGTATVLSSPGSGTVVTIEVPTPGREVP